MTRENATKPRYNDDTQEWEYPPGTIETTTLIDTTQQKIYEQILYPTTTGPQSKYIDKNNNLYDHIEHEGKIYRPVPETDKTITKKAILLPTYTINHIDTPTLIQEIQNHIHTYLDLSPNYETLASWYILLTWIYDHLNTLPYLRATGDTSTGKSRFLDTIGRLCYKPMIVSGAITPAAIYRMIDRWHGTMILDEADMKHSDTTNEIITILNSGFERNRPVLRCDKDNNNNVDPYETYGPKIIATRQRFRDTALESRCITETMRDTTREDIPFQLPTEFYEKETELRNKLLHYRLHEWFKLDNNTIQKIDLGNIENRLKQTMASFAVLFHTDKKTITIFQEFLQQYQKELIEERSESYDGIIINTIYWMTHPENTTLDTLNTGNLEPYITSTDIATVITENYNMDTKPITIGRHLKSLKIDTKSKKVDGKTHRVIDFNPETQQRLKKLYKKYVTGVNGTKNPVTVTKVTDVTDTMGGEDENYNNKIKSGNDTNNPTLSVSNVTSVTVTKKIVEIMSTRPHTEWSLGELVDKTGINHKDLFPILENNQFFVRSSNDVDGIFYHLKNRDNGGGV